MQPSDVDILSDLDGIADHARKNQAVRQGLRDNLSDRRGAAQWAGTVAWSPLRRPSLQTLCAGLLLRYFLLLAFPVVAAFIGVTAGGNGQVVAFTLTLAHLSFLLAV